ncbi:GntR family transcriptional regulator [Actinacidiphila oryziradicis]|uniref:FadR/GntR family transcriptional regulator n=1 Tax=Actinacidiphila oryziradicis TaxID=2571141 RepID=UPI0023F40E38|nr:GntR family transcriptional regulator [Actinacidiphila oryziradicis]MCW2874541.1 GntR family transcriptional regulator [Actinacidiphila oryziradicis]
MTQPGPDSTRRGQAQLSVRRLRPAYQQVADELRGQIIAGTLQSGERLPIEPELAQLFGVSRSTVREALRVLVSQHLVETTRGVQGGSFVACPDTEKLIEDMSGALGVLVMTPRLSVSQLLEARILFEPPATRLAADRADRSGVQAVMAAAKAPRERSDPSGFTPHINFHATVLMASGNLMLPLMLEPVTEVLRVRLERRRAHERGLWDDIDRCHIDIATAIARGDGDSAEETMRRHLLDLLPLYEEIDIHHDVSPDRR